MLSSGAAAFRWHSSHRVHPPAEFVAASDFESEFGKRTDPNGKRKHEQYFTARKRMVTANNDATVESASDCITVAECFQFHPQIVGAFDFDTLNRMQSVVAPLAYKTDDSLVISAPTGGGKTFVFESAILRFLGPDFGAGRVCGVAKVLYIAPIKALIQERIVDWRKRLGGKLGLEFLELTGDVMYHTNMRALSSADVLLATPEKLDSITRRRSSCQSLLGSIGLVLLDEVHHIADGYRGATLEAIVCRLMNFSRLQASLGRTFPIVKLRFIALSATFPNICDIAHWLRCPPGNAYEFGSEYRPVPLESHVLGYTSNRNAFIFEKNLDYRVMDVIKKYSEGRPTLIFCSSRKSASNLAQHLVTKDNARSMLSMEQKRALVNVKLSDKSLSDCVTGGVGFHHAGLTMKDRNILEGLFCSGGLPVLCSTSTLALGVNLPARLVVVKSTQLYQGGSEYEEYPMSKIRQMIGRAGRAGLDTKGVAVIMTQVSQKRAYEEALRTGAGKEIESCLLDHIVEVLNSEVVLENVSDVSEAIEWVKHYAMNSGSSDALKRLCTNAVAELGANGLLVQDSEGFSFCTTRSAEIMSQKYIRFQTMKCFQAIASKMDLEEMIETIAGSEELQFPLRRKEKRLLNELNTDKIRFRVKNQSKKYNVQTATMKSNILIQCIAGGVDVEDCGLRHEMSMIAQTLERVLPAAVELLVDRKMGKTVYMAHSLMRSISQKTWDDDGQQLRQLRGVGKATASKLQDAGILTIRCLARTSPSVIENILHRRAPFGDQLVGEARAVPDLNIEAHQLPHDKSTVARLEIRIISGSIDTSSNNTSTGYYNLLAYSSQEKGLLLYRSRVVAASSATVDIPRPYIDCKSLRIHILLVHNTFVGVDVESIYNLLFDCPEVMIKSNVLSRKDTIDIGKLAENAKLIQVSEPPGKKESISLQKREKPQSPKPKVNKVQRSHTISGYVAEDNSFTKQKDQISLSPKCEVSSAKKSNPFVEYALGNKLSTSDLKYTPAVPSNQITPHNTATVHESLAPNSVGAMALLGTTSLPLKFSYQEGPHSFDDIFF